MHVYIRQLSNISRGNGIKTVCVCVGGGGWGVTGDNLVHTCTYTLALLAVSQVGSTPLRVAVPATIT